MLALIKGAILNPEKGLHFTHRNGTYFFSFLFTVVRVWILNSVFSLTWPASMQIYGNKRNRLHKKRVQLPQDWFGTQTWPP